MIKKMISLKDSIKSLVNSLANNRNSLNTNEMSSNGRLPYDQCRAMYKTGLGNKIIRLKAGYAMADTVEFVSEDDHKDWHSHLEHHVTKAIKYMLAYGRGIIVLHETGDNLSKPRENFDIHSTHISVFSGDMVTVGTVSYDLQSARYLKPEFYTVRGVPIHYSRVIDFTYVEPPEFEAPQYLYGGISEYELIKNQIMNDGIIERASAHIIEKSSNFVYKIKDFRQNIAAGQTDSVVEYVTATEEMRSIYGALLIDGEDEATVLTQQLSNLQEINEMSLRRLAMVTGIPLSNLVGEAVRGLNATGDNEYVALMDMIKQLQSAYIKNPLWQLLDKFNYGERWFKDNQAVSDEDMAEYEGKIIDNATKLQGIGEDSRSYLTDKGIAKREGYEEFFNTDNPNDEVDASNSINEILGDAIASGSINPPFTNKQSTEES